MYYFPYKWREQKSYYKYYSLLYGHLAYRKSFKNKLLLLHNRLKSITDIFHKKNAQLSYNKTHKSVKYFW